MSSLSRVLVVALWVWLGLPAGARAQATPDDAQIAEAKRFFEAGRQAYEAGQYLVSATAFEAAFRLAPRPPVAFSMAQAYRRQYFVDRDPAKLKRALDLYKQYIIDVPQGGRRDDAIEYVAELEPLLQRVEDEWRKKGLGPVKAMEPPSSEATQLMISSRTKGAAGRLDDDKLAEVPVIREVKPGKHKIRVEARGYFPDEVEGIAVAGRLVVVEVNLRAQPARLLVRARPGAEVSIDGRPVGALPLLRPLEVTAGRHFVSVAERGYYAYNREIHVERGQELAIDAPLRRTRQRMVSYWVLGTAGAVLLAGATTSTLAFVHQGRAQDLLDRKAAHGLSQEELDEYLRQRGLRDDYVTASYFLYGGAIAIAASGALLYLTDVPRVQMTAPTSDGASEDALTPTDQEPTLSPTVGAGGMMGLVLSGTF